ncbi:MAG: GNAT family N-acetyltransferase [Chloroflexota bacterium]|nr:GNAT family N-acetyltransferase [Chloroflexota bacterium]
MSIRLREATIADAPALADVVIEPIVTAFQGLVPDQCLNWIGKEESTANWQRHLSPGGREAHLFLRVAETATGLVVGCALGGRQDNEPAFQGELYLLGVLPAYQGQGIGRRLVTSVAKQLAQTDIHSLGVHVLTINPHRRFYERLGGRYLREQPYDWSGIQLAEAIYHWPDTAALRT